MKLIIFELFMILTILADKITICHIPRGYPDNSHTITIYESAWPAHESHGDYMGLHRAYEV